MTAAKRRFDVFYHRHPGVLALIILAVGVIVALLMIEHEVNQRTSGDRTIEHRLDRADQKRIDDNERLLHQLETQVSETERINRIQNQILRALLAAEKRDPAIFGGVNLPRLSSLLEPSGGGRETGSPKGNQSTGGGTGVHATTHRDPVRPSSSSTSGSGNENTSQPPVAHAPVAPAPARPAIAPILQPLVDVPVVGPILEQVLVPQTQSLDAVLANSAVPLTAEHC